MAANPMFNLGTIVAAICALVALHRSLPPDEQPHYSWLTAPFFPRRIGLMGRFR
jgi:hypothetical protein